MSDAEAKADLILEHLRKDPDIAWALARKLAVAGPWERVRDDWWQRQACWDDSFNVATLRIEKRWRTDPTGKTVKTNGWHWSEFSWGDEEVAGKGGYEDVEECRAACDAWLESRGYILFETMDQLPKVGGLRALGSASVLWERWADKVREMMPK